MSLGGIICHVWVVINVVQSMVKFKVLFGNLSEQKDCVAVSVIKELVVLRHKWVMGKFCGGFDVMIPKSCL